MNRPLHYSIDVQDRDCTAITADGRRVIYVPGHSLGGGWTRQIVELCDGDSADNPSSTKAPLYGGTGKPQLVVYDTAPDGGVRTIIYDSVKDFYASLFNAPPVDAMQAIVTSLMDEAVADYDRRKDAGEEVSGHDAEHLKVIAFWLAGNK